MDQFSHYVALLPREFIIECENLGDEKVTQWLCDGCVGKSLGYGGQIWSCVRVHICDFKLSGFGLVV